MNIKIVDVAQNSDDWHRARMGIATASEFHRIITTSGQSSSSADKYVNQILAEEIVDHPIQGYQSAKMLEGQQREDEAVRCFEMEYRVETTRVGFVHNVPRTMGCSPDRLVGKDAFLEVKNPDPDVHVSYLLNPESLIIAYSQQVQGTAGILNLFGYLMSYYPEMPPLIIKVRRNESYIKAILGAVDCFNVKLAKRRETLEGLGHIKPKRKSS